MARAINYLNNKDILKEIHKSKISYCWYKNEGDSEYDVIIRDVAEIPALLVPSIVTDEDGVKSVAPPAAQTARAKRLTVLAQDASILDGKKLKADEIGITAEDIPVTDIIFRLMTWGHIPEAPPAVPKPPKGKKQKVVEVADEVDSILTTEYDEPEPDITPVGPVKYVKVNFPPFEHFRVDADGTPLPIIGRSHWKGDLATGEYSRMHGQTTKKLALMYMKLCERYATRSNWRGYTYNDEMRSQALLQLSQIGLQFDESKSANPFAYYTAAITNSFTSVLNIEKRNQNIRDDILEINGLNPSYTRQGMSGGGPVQYEE